MLEFLAGDNYEAPGVTLMLTSASSNLREMRSAKQTIFWVTQMKRYPQDQIE
jgi:hypothetical protein